MDNIKETIEALIFASGEPVSKKDIIERIPSLTTRELNKIVEELKVKYGGDSGIVLASFNDKLQFTSNPRYGDTLVEVLTPIREKALSQSLLEVLSIIAYKQPVTRQEIEDIKGGKDPDYALSVLMKVNLIEVKGRKDAVGRPFLFGTTDEFLRKFQLEDLGNLPDYNEVLDRISILDKNFRDTARDGLYFEKELNVDQPDFIEVGGAVPEFSAKDIAADETQIEPENNDDFDDMDEDFNDVPEFLKDEEYEEYK